MNSTFHQSFFLDKVLRILLHCGERVNIRDLLILAKSEKIIEKSTALLLLEESDWFSSTDGIYWKLTDWEKIFPNRLLRDTEFIVTDIETTGPRTGKDKIIEIAGVKVKLDREDEIFHQFVNPQKNLPWQIRRLTGVKDRDLADQPEISETLPLFEEFCGEGYFCAHNADFDFHFINSEFHQLGKPFLFSRPELCTLRIAMKLYPQIRTPGLKGLAEFFSYEFSDRHMALEDAQATAHYLKIFIGDLLERGIEDIYGLIRFQLKEESNSKIRSRVGRIKSRKKQKQLNTVRHA